MNGAMMNNGASYKRTTHLEYDSRHNYSSSEVFRDMLRVLENIINKQGDQQKIAIEHFKKDILRECRSDPYFLLKLNRANSSIIHHLFYILNKNKVIIPENIHLLVDFTFETLHHFCDKHALLKLFNQTDVQGLTLFNQAVRTGSDRLVLQVLKIMQPYQDILHKYLSETCKTGNVLFDAISAGSMPILTIILDILQQEPYQEILYNHLNETNNAGFTLLSGAIKTSSVPILTKILNILQQKPYKNILYKQLSETNSAGFTPLLEAINTGSTAILVIMLNILQQEPYKNILYKNLSQTHKSGFNVLFGTIKIGSEPILTLILDILQQTPHKAILHKLLNETPKKDFNVLMHTIKTGSESILTIMLDILQQTPHKAILHKLLNETTKEGFNVLMHTIKTGSIPILTIMLDILQQKSYQAILHKNLSETNNAGFNVLLTAIKTCSVPIVTKILDTLQLASFQEILFKQLRETNQAGFNVLVQAVATGSVPMVGKILNILQLAPYLEILYKNLSETNKAGFNVLLTAITTDSAPILTIILDILQQRPYQNILHRHLSTPNKAGFSVLFSAIKTGNLTLMQTLLTVLAKDVSALKWNLQHTFQNRENVLHLAVEQGPAFFFILIKAIEENFSHDATRMIEDLVFSTLNKGRIYSKNKAIHRYLEDLTRGQARASRHYYEITDLREKDEESASFEKVEKIENDNAISNESRKRKHSTLFSIEEHEPNLVMDEERMPKRTKDASSELLATASEPNFDKHDKGKDKVCEKEKEEVCHRKSALDYQYRGQLSQPFIREQKKTTAVSPILTPATIVKPFGGINDKYLGGKRVSALSIDFIPAGQGLAQKHYFLPLNTLRPASTTRDAHIIQIQQHPFQFVAMLHSHQKTPHANEQVTFICAGRKQEALVPNMENQGRCILVCTSEEYTLLSSRLPSWIEVLEIQKLHSNEGIYENVGLITSRRLSLFLAAYHWDLQNFLMLDDNIHQVSFEGTNHTWTSFYELLLASLGREPCVSVTKHFSTTPRHGQLGSKLFMIDLAKIKANLSNIWQVFFLFPRASQAKQAGEDYYFQVALHLLFRLTAQGYRILDKSLAFYSRSSKNRDSCLQSLSLVDGKTFSLFEPNHRGLTKEICKLMNEIIVQNQQRYTQQLLEEEEENEVVSVPKILPSPPDLNFIPNYKKTLQESDFTQLSLRPYQIEAVHAVGNDPSSLVQLILATGSGKTKLLNGLLQVALTHLSAHKHMALVTPNIELVSQLYADCVQFMNECTVMGLASLATEQIIAISSQHIPEKQIAARGYLNAGPRLFIFCVVSLIEWLKTHEAGLSAFSFIALDECHAYHDKTKFLSEQAEHDNVMMVGVTATPKSESELKTIYTYSLAQGIKDGFLAPLQLKRLPYEDPKELIVNLPDLLNKFLHPKFGTQARLLKEVKGIVYLPSIEVCNQALTILQTANITAYAIHSDNPRHKQDLAEFKERTGNAILLACHMCQMGFNDVNIGYVIIGQGTKDKDTLTQMIGRVVRYKENKIALILSIKSSYNTLAKLIEPPLSQTTQKAAFITTNPRPFLIQGSKENINRAASTKNRARAKMSDMPSFRKKSRCE